MKMNWSVVAGILLISLIGCGKRAPSEDTGEKPAVAVQLAAATVKPLRNLVSLNGSFAPAQGSAARLTAAVPGRIKAVLVKEGDQVKQGELLATLDTGVQVSQKASAAAALEAAQAQTSQSQLTYQAALADQKANVATARVALDQARSQRDADVTQSNLAYEASKADLAKTRAGARPQEIAQAHEATVQAQATRDRALSENRRVNELAPSGWVSRRQLEDAQTALATAESALSAAQANESLVRAGARPEELRAAEAHTAAARNALISARTIGDQKVATAATALRQAEAAELSVQAKQKDVAATLATERQRAADVATANATVQLSEIRAPFDGRISRRMVNQGDAMDTTTTAFEILRTSGANDFVAGAVPSDAQQIHPGMAAEITFGSEKAKGAVVAVSNVDPTTGLSTVRIASSEGPVAGTYGTASVVVATLPHAIAVPDGALLYRDNKTMVLRDVDGVAKETEVEAGPSDSGFTAITSGVKPGEKVVLLGANELDDGTKITAAPAKSDEGDKS